MTSIRLRGLWRVPDIDVVLAFAAFVGLLADSLSLHKVSELTPLIVAVAFAAAVPLAFRRRAPLLVLAAELPLLLLCLTLFHPKRAALGITMLLLFTVGLKGRRARSLVIGAVMALIVAGVVLATSEHPEASDFVAYPSLSLGALIAGDALRARQSLQRVVAEEAAHAREAAAQHRFDQERLVLAHELHDVIGHTLVVINVRAAAAAHRAAKTEPGEAGVVLAEIASTSAEALAELRTTLKALRAENRGPAPLHPVQDLASLDDLILGVHEAGLKVTLEMSGDPAVLPKPVSHAVYRIVQEGLTNVMRHSAAHAARVSIAVEDHCTLIDVLDAGPSRAAGDRTPGHGLQGMRERAAALGGVCQAGPADPSGWRVHASIPLANAGS